ncbi:hypothetical protein Tco_0745490, partial [Tanacetum coccineum]
MPLKDEVLPPEEQPLLAAASPTADSPGYVPKSHLEEDTEEDDDKDPKVDPADYPADRGDDGDDEDESSDNDEDDDVDIEGDKEEEEEHPAPADSIAVALPAVDHAPSAKETNLFEIDESAATPPPHPAYRVTARICDDPAERRGTIYFPSTTTTITYCTSMYHTRASVAMIRADAPFTYILASRSETPPSGIPPLLPIPLPTPSPPLLFPSTNCRAGVSKDTLPPQKRLCIVLGPRFEVGKSSSAPIARPTGDLRRDYGFVA